VDFRQASGLIKKGTVKPVYLFYGREDFLQEKLLREILAVLQRQGRDFELEKIDGSEASLEEMVQFTRQGTIFSQGRLLFIHGCPAFQPAGNGPGGGKDGKKKKKTDGKTAADKEGERILLALLEEGISELVLVFSVPQVDRRKKLVKELEKSGCLIEFPLLRGKALAGWIRNELKAERKQIEEGALYELVGRTGENLRLLRSELDKIITYLPPNDSLITADAVRRLVPQTSQGNIFKLVEALGRKELKGAWYHLHQMLQQGEPPLVVLAMIARQFRLLYRAVHIMEGGGSQLELSTSLKVPGFVARDLAAQVRGFDGETLAAALEYVKQVDLEIKTGQRSEVEALEQLVLQLASGELSPSQK